MCFRGHWAQAYRSCPEREKTYLFLEVEADGLGPSGLDIGTFSGLSCSSGHTSHQARCDMCFTVRLTGVES